MTGLRRLDNALLDELMARAVHSPRRRQHINLHSSYDDPCQRLINAICPDSYIRPHRHLIAPRVETLLVLRGQARLILFNDQGAVVDVSELASNGSQCGFVGVEIVPDVWHTVVADAAGVILLEVKAGPFDPAMAKEMASWAPDDGSAAARDYLCHLKKLILTRSIP